MDRLMVGVSGVRGTVGRTLTPRVACDFGCAFGTMLGAGKTVALGRDSRTSGPTLRSAVLAGLLGTGVNVIDLGIASTPAAALMTSKLECDGGVILTASHNPAQYNGVKFLRPSGVGLSAAGAQRLKEIWQAGDYAFADQDSQGTATTNTTAAASYVEAVCAYCDVEAVGRGGFMVVLDSTNGAGGPSAKLLFERLGCELVHLNAEPHGRFAHPPEPVEENLSELCAAVREHGAAVGFAQDADADRLAIVDERGRFIGEEYTLALAAAFVLGKRAGRMATNLATSRMIDDLAERHGCDVVRSPTGEANVVDAMVRDGCIFGGEGGGGVIDPRIVPVRNSLSGMAMVLQHLAETGKTVSQLVDDIPRYVMLKTKMPCPPGAAEKIARRAREVFAGREGVRFNDADGLRVDLPGRWVCVRASNTEPILRIIAEAPTQADADALVAETRAVADAVIATKT